MGNLTPYIKSSVNTAGGKKTFKLTSTKAITGAGVSLVKTQLLKKVLPNLESDTGTHTSYLGTTVYDSLVLGELNETNTYINILGEGVEYAPIRFNEVLLDVSMIRNIVSTAVQGRNSTIKQYISDSDYSILVNGRISGKWNGSTWSKNGQYYPEQEIQNLVNICKAGYMIPVTSNYLNNIFGIEHIVIQDYRLAQSEGGRYSQVFELNCLSDQDVILEFTEEDVNNEETLDYILNV